MRNFDPEKITGDRVSGLKNPPLKQVRVFRAIFFHLLNRAGTNQLQLGHVVGVYILKALDFFPLYLLYRLYCDHQINHDPLEISYTFFVGILM